MNLPSKVKIFEVGPRDGLQNEKDVVPVDVEIPGCPMSPDAFLKAVNSLVQELRPAYSQSVNP